MRGVLRSAAKIAQWLGDTGLNILKQVFGLLLAAMAVEVIASLRLLLPVVG